MACFIGLEMSLWLLVASGSGLKRVLILVVKDFSMSSDFSKGGERVFSNDREGNLGSQKGLCVL